MIAPSASLFDRLSLLADPLRCRVLVLLEKRELSVAELVRAMQLPQSTVSRHLKSLAAEGLVTSREEGASNRYTMSQEGFDLPVRKLWAVLREQASELPAAREDARRLTRVLSARKTRSQEYFSSAAGHWDRIRRELFGESSHLHALLALLDRSMTVGDLGAGTGIVSQALAPFVRRVIAVDDSTAMLAAARKRLGSVHNVELRRGDLLDLPIADADLDLAVLFLVLAFVDEPGKALAEVRRVLRPGGRALVVDMFPHDREDIAREMGHVWRGFSAEQVNRWSADAGFGNADFITVPADPSARGPSLFVAVLERNESSAESRSRSAK
jgi:ArsR family transcriptional regulator